MPGLLRGSLTNFFSRLAIKHKSPNPHLPSSWDYSSSPPCPDFWTYSFNKFSRVPFFFFFFLLKVCKSFTWFHEYNIYLLYPKAILWFYTADSLNSKLLSWVDCLLKGCIVRKLLQSQTTVTRFRIPWITYRARHNTLPIILLCEYYWFDWYRICLSY